MTDDLLALADRVEAATGPDRELDALVFIATSWPEWKLQTDCEPFPDAVEIGRIQEPDGFGWREAPKFTASIDAALTLVPEGWFVSGISEFNQRTWVATLREGNPPKRHVSSQLYDRQHGCKSAALAITAAALRARAAQTPAPKEGDEQR